MIIQDVEKLRQVSKPVDLNEGYTDKVLSLVSHMPSIALGLAAPQIDMFERLFVANLSLNTYVFINPRITEKSESKCKSIESCLSLPNITRAVSRHLQIKIYADVIYKINIDATYHTMEPLDITGMVLTYQDAYIVQHEYDHLEGVLIIDLPPYEEDTKLSDKRGKKLQRINARKTSKNNSKQVVAKKTAKISAKKETKIKKLRKKEKKQRRQAQKQKQKIVEIKERYEARKEGLLN